MAEQPATPSRKNSRRSRRLASKTSTRVMAYRNSMGLGPNIALRALDISESGARLVLKEPLPLGHEFELAMEGPALRPFRCLANIVWIIKAEDGTFVVGAHLQKHVTHQHLSALVRS